MPFLLAEILNFQGSTHHIGVGSFSELYKDNFNITSFDKKYMVSFMNRNDRKAEHLIITNY